MAEARGTMEMISEAEAEGEAEARREEVGMDEAEAGRTDPTMDEELEVELERIGESFPRGRWVAFHWVWRAGRAEEVLEGRVMEISSSRFPRGVWCHASDGMGFGVAVVVKVV